MYFCNYNLKENVKERLAGSGILKESEDEDEEQQEEKGEKQEEKDGTQEEKETLVNGHTGDFRWNEWYDNYISFNTVSFSLFYFAL